MQQLLENKAHLESKNKEDEEAYRMKKKTFDLLPNADENIAKLQVCLCREKMLHLGCGILLVSWKSNQGLVQSSCERATKLAGKWEEVRAPLVDELRNMKLDSEATEVSSACLCSESTACLSTTFIVNILFH